MVFDQPGRTHPQRPAPTKTLVPMTLSVATGVLLVGLASVGGHAYSRTGELFDRVAGPYSFQLPPVFLMSCKFDHSPMQRPVVYNQPDGQKEWP